MTVVIKTKKGTTIIKGGKSVRRGRPPKGPYEDKRSTLSTRITRSLRSRLEAAAEDTGRSLSQDIEFRLEQSFLSEEAKFEALGGKRIYGLMRLLGATVSLIEAGTGKRWQEDQETYDQVRGTISSLFDGLGPRALVKSHDETLLAKAEVLSEVLATVILEGEAARTEGSHKTAMALLDVVSDLWVAMDSDQDWLDARTRLVQQYGAGGKTGSLVDKVKEG